MINVAIAAPNQWLPPPTPLTLGQHEVHVWCASLEWEKVQVWQLYQYLSEDERQRADQFHFEKDQAHFIVARSLLRIILSRYLGFDAKALRFCYGVNGKPALIAAQGGKRLQFNLSHSQGWALYAVTHDRAIGVDIEGIRPNLLWSGMAERCLTPRELAVLQTLPSHLQCQAFFTAWTRKEAYLKARGLGLSTPLDHVEVALIPGEPAVLLTVQWNPQEAKRWILQNLRLAPGYVGAVAVEGDRTTTQDTANPLQFHLWQYPTQLID
ncbi:MAG TPA: 4'-phosphopantetheinyl transferase family protein [Elainellaceae cyanobacterium]